MHHRVLPALSALLGVLSFVSAGPAFANCSAELLAVSRFGFERIPGEQMARQIYEMRKSSAHADLAACERAEREAERQAKQRAEEASRQISYPQHQTATLQYDNDAAMIAAHSKTNQPEFAEQRLKKAISYAILDSRCDDARFLALRASRIDLAEQAKGLCQPAPSHSTKVQGDPVPIEKGTWVTGGDYPPSALAERRTGRTTAVFDIAETGYIENCSIQLSSGHADLDAQTCVLFQLRGLFIPPVDGKGKRIRVRHHESVNWVLNF